MEQAGKTTGPGGIEIPWTAELPKQGTLLTPWFISTMGFFIFYHCALCDAATRLSMII